MPELVWYNMPEEAASLDLGLAEVSKAVNPSKPCLKADVAQWQSSGFVNRRSRVQLPSSAPFFRYNNGLWNQFPGAVVVPDLHEMSTRDFLPSRVRLQLNNSAAPSSSAASSLSSYFPDCLADPASKLAR